MTLQEARKVIGLNIHNLNGSMQMAVATIMDALEEKAEIIGYLQPSEDLEAKAAQYESYFDVGEQHGYLCVNKGEMAEAFKDGARWQKEQILKGDRLTEFDKSYKQAKRELEWFKEGKRQGREQMLKEADKWLKEHINDYIVKGRDIDLMFDDFIKAMEEKK